LSSCVDYSGKRRITQGFLAALWAKMSESVAAGKNSRKMPKYASKTHKKGYNSSKAEKQQKISGSRWAVAV